MAGVLAGGKNSRLYKRLVYELQVAQDVTAFQEQPALASTFSVVVTARSGHDLEEMPRLVDEEIAKLQAAPPSRRASCSASRTARGVRSSTASSAWAASTARPTS